MLFGPVNNAHVSADRLPRPELAKAQVSEAHARYQSTAGELARVYSTLAELFGPRVARKSAQLGTAVPRTRPLTHRGAKATLPASKRIPKNRCYRSSAWHIDVAYGEYPSAA
jgi:predicted Zn-dependent protease